MTNSQQPDYILLKLEEHDQNFENIKQNLEHELRVNIQRIAEGHLDLFRELQALTKLNAEVEMLSIKVRMLESDVRELKSKIS